LRTISSITREASIKSSRIGPGVTAGIGERSTIDGACVGRRTQGAQMAEMVTTVPIILITIITFFAGGIDFAVAATP
jgi:hypothetical protein